MRILLILALVVSCFIEDSNGKEADKRSNMSNSEILMEDFTKLYFE